MGETGKSRVGRKVAGIILALVLMGGVAVVVSPDLRLAACAVFGNDPFNDRVFDEDLWKHSADTEDVSNPRGPMVDDLIANHLRPGMTRQEVTALLGDPDFDTKGDVATYYLGHWSGLRWDPDVLECHFGAAGELSKALRVQW